MAILRVVRYPDKRLREKCVEVPLSVEAKDRTKVFSDMEDTLDSMPSGLALAANQVGLTGRIVVFSQKGKLDIHPWVTNPQITKTYGEKVYMTEGCLSLPGMYREVKRWHEIDVKYDAFDGTFLLTTEKKLTGLSAQCMQHEIDHLNGVMFLDDLPKAEREKLVLAMARGRR